MGLTQSAVRLGRDLATPQGILNGLIDGSKNVFGLVLHVLQKAIDIVFNTVELVRVRHPLIKLVFEPLLVVVLKFFRRVKFIQKIIECLLGSVGQSTQPRRDN